MRAAPRVKGRECGRQAEREGLSAVEQARVEKGRYTKAIY